MPQIASNCLLRYTYSVAKKKIVITGGHLTPALAVIEELEKKKRWLIYFLGRRYTSEAKRTVSMEVELLRKKKLTFIPIAAGKIQRRWNRYAFLSYLKIPFGFFQAFYYLLKIRPQIVLSFGGYVSVPIVLAGWLLRTPIINHEQTTTYGLASKFNSLFAQKIAVSWSSSKKFFPKKKVVLTGNPIRKNLLKFDKKIWQVFGFDSQLPLIFITGGNQGSHIINQTTKEIIGQLVKDHNVFHQAGHLNVKGDFEELKETRQKLPFKLRKRYHCKKYLNDREMGTFLNKADLVVSRAGANIVTELAVLGKPSLFIPIPWSYADEQNKNAEMLVKTGTAKILPQSQLTPEKLYQSIKEVIANLQAYKKNSAKAKKLVRLDAAKKIVNLIEESVR